MREKELLEEHLEQYFDLSERKKAFAQKTFHTLELEIIETCNLRCFYCYPESSPESKRKISLEKAQQVIDEVVENGIKELVVLGGEPLLHPQWADILRYAKSRGLRTVLYTNGTLLGDNIKDVLATVDWLRLHLDSVSLEEFLATQKPKSTLEHGRIIDGVESLLDAGFDGENIELVIPLTIKSYRTLRETLEYAKNKWGVGVTTLVPIVDYGAAKCMKPEDKLSSEQYKKAFQLRADIEKRPWLMRLGTSEFPKEYQTTTFLVTVSGDIIPYPALSIVCGNIYQEDLREILTRSYSTLAFREILNADGKQNLLEGECGSCEYEKHCFGTRSMAYNNGKGLQNSDPTCWLVNEEPHQRNLPISK